MKNVKLLFFILNIFLIFNFSLSSLCKDSIFDPIFINTPRSFRVQPSKEVCYKYKLSNSKNKISLTFSLAKSYTSEVVIYKSLYEIRMKNNEYIDYRDKYFIVDYTFKEINVSDFYDYVYIIIRETKNYFFNDKIVLYDSEVPITLVGNTPIEMTHFMSNNEYTFTFSSNKNLQFVYSSKLQSQKFLTVEYDGNYAVKGKIDNKDFIINLENKDLSEKVLNIRVSNYDENSETPDFSIIVYEKEPIDIIKIEEEKSIEIFYIQNDLTQNFYFYSDISKYTKSGSINFKVDYMVKNIKYMNIISDIIYSDKALSLKIIKENIPQKNNLEYSYDINSDEFIRFYFQDKVQNYEYKYIIIKLEIKDYLVYFSPKSFTVSLSKELEEINLKEIPYYTTKTITKSTKPYIPNYFKLLFDPKSTYILTAPYQDYILLLKGDLLSNSKINQNYLDDQKDIIIIRDISELTVQIFGNELNAVFYVEKIDRKEIYIIENTRDIKEISVMNKIILIHFLECFGFPAINNQEISNTFHSKGTPINITKIEDLKENIFDDETNSIIGKLNERNIINIPVEKKKPLIILDASNVAMRHGDQKFSTKGIQIAMDFFNKNGHDVISFLPEYFFRQKDPNSIINKKRVIPDNVEYLNELYKKHLVIQSPPQDYDDSYCIQYAKNHDSFIVTNDLFRDYLEKINDNRKRETERIWIKERSISFTFNQDEFIPNPDATFFKNYDINEYNKMIK